MVIQQFFPPTEAASTLTLQQRILELEAEVERLRRVIEYKDKTRLDMTTFTNLQAENEKLKKIILQYQALESSMWIVNLAPLLDLFTVRYEVCLMKHFSYASL